MEEGLREHGNDGAVLSEGTPKLFFSLLMLTRFKRFHGSVDAWVHMLEVVRITTAHVAKILQVAEKLKGTLGDIIAGSLEERGL